MIMLGKPKENLAPIPAQIMIDLRSFDIIIESILAKHIPYRFEEIKNKNFIPGIYQVLANELSFYRNKFRTNSVFSTRSFRNAYLKEEYDEIVDELFCELRNIIIDQFKLNIVKYGLTITMITHNQWAVRHHENKKALSIHIPDRKQN